MTCLIGEGSPGRDGTTAPPATAASGRSKRSLVRTWAVHFSSWFSSRAGIIDSVPVIIEPTYCDRSVVRYGFGPPGFGPAPSPLALVTSRCPPSGATVTVVGYQPVGMSPETRSGCFSSARRTTTTSLFPAAAAYRVRPSGDTDRPRRIVPTGALWYGETLMWRFISPLVPSSTAMLSSSVADT